MWLDGNILLVFVFTVWNVSTILWPSDFMVEDSYNKLIDETYMCLKTLILEIDIGPQSRSGIFSQFYIKEIVPGTNE